MNEPINTPDPGRPVNVGSGGRARGDQPAELNPAMVERVTSDPTVVGIAEDCGASPEFVARAALTAAGVSALAAEVERLRGEVGEKNHLHREWMTLRESELVSANDQRDAALARATSAEQERDRLRAGIERIVCAVDADGQANVAPALTLGAVRDDLRVLLAGSGEQPAPTALVRVEWGVVLDDLGSTDVYDTREEAEARAGRDSTVVRIETWRVGSGEQPGEDWPTRVNRASLATGRALAATNEHEPNGRCQADNCPARPGELRPAPVVPDSPDVYEAIRAFIEEEVGFDGGPGMDDQARRLTDRVLAVVGQGVTAEVEDEECAPDCEERTACDKAGLGHSMCGRCEHGEPRHHGGHFHCAAVRPTGQEQS